MVEPDQSKNLLNSLVVATRQIEIELRRLGYFDLADYYRQLNDAAELSPGQEILECQVPVHLWDPFTLGFS